MSGFGWIREDATLAIGLMFIWCSIYSVPLSV